MKQGMHELASLSSRRHALERREMIEHTLGAQVRIETEFLGQVAEYLPMRPSLRTTRWHGIRSGTGFLASADPVARTAPGRPISLAIQL